MVKRAFFCILATINLVAWLLILADVNNMAVKVLLIALAVVLLVDGILQGVAKPLIFVGALMNFMLLWNMWAPQPIPNIGAMLLFAGSWGLLLSKDS